MRKRVALLVYVDLDPVPGGAFSDEDSALKLTADILDQRIGHYNPIVSFAPDSFQPLNSPVTGVESGNDLLVVEKGLGESLFNERPLAGNSPSDIGVLTTSDFAISYTGKEGYHTA